MNTNERHGLGQVIPREGGLVIEYIDTAKLRPDPQNPRIHGDKQLRQIARSIETFGFNVPVLIDTNSQVIAGHGGAGCHCAVRARHDVAAEHQLGQQGAGQPDAQRTRLQERLAAGLVMGHQVQVIGD